jgi:hypothetical protein
MGYMSSEIEGSGRIAPAIAIVLGIVLRIGFLAGASAANSVLLILAVTLVRVSRGS